ncbi:MAG: tetratricopeptide repeat protein [Vicingaceae bacterium]
MKDDKKYNKGVELLKAEKFDEALQLFNELLKEFPKNADYWSERGVVYFHMQKKSEALADMNKALELQPKKSYRYSSRAYILGHFGQTKAAIADYQKAIELDPEDAIAHNNLGLLEEQLGYKEKAQSRFTKADELDKKSFGKTDRGIEGEPIDARNIQKEINAEKADKSLWSTLKSIGTKEGLSSFVKFIKSGFKET